MSRSRSGNRRLKASDDKVIVNSETYGEHTRAPRGSKTRAVLNSAMKESSHHLASGTIPARLIHNALKPYRANFPGGTLWQRLLTYFTAQARKNQPYSVVGIEHWDVNKKHLTSRIMTPNLEIKKDSSSAQLVISLNYTLGRRFLERKRNIGGFQVTIILLFPDFVHNDIIVLPTVLPEKKLDDHSLYSFVVQIPSGADSYIACFKAEACIGGVPENSYVGKAMSLYQSGMLDEVKEVGKSAGPE